MKRLLSVSALMLALSALMPAIPTYATLYTDRSLWEAAVGGSFAMVDLPGTAYSFLPKYSTQIPLPDGSGGFFNFGVPLYRVDLGNGWDTWSPGTPTDTELLRAYEFDINVNYTANFTFYPEGVTVGPVSAFGFEAQPLNSGSFTMLLFTSLYQELYQSINGNGGAKFFGWVDEPITGFSVISYEGSGGFAMGNFVQGVPAPVPEPSTFILLGAGLAGLVAWRRKRS